MNCEWIILIAAATGLILGMLAGLAVGMIVVKDLRNKLKKTTPKS